MYKITKNRGALLIEFLIALAIFTFCLSGLMVLQSRTASLISDIDSETLNAFLVKDIYDRIELNLPFAKEYESRDLGANKKSNGASNAYVKKDIKEISENASSLDVSVSISISNYDRGSPEQGFVAEVTVLGGTEDDDNDERKWLHKSERYIQFIPSDGQSYSNVR